MFSFIYTRGRYHGWGSREVIRKKSTKKSMILNEILLSLFWTKASLRSLKTLLSTQGLLSMKIGLIINSWSWWLKDFYLGQGIKTLTSIGSMWRILWRWNLSGCRIKSICKLNEQDRKERMLMILIIFRLGILEYPIMEKSTLIKTKTIRMKSLEKISILTLKMSSLIGISKIRSSQCNLGNIQLKLRESQKLRP